MFTTEIPSAQRKHNFRCRNAISGQPAGRLFKLPRPSPYIPMDCSLSLSNAIYSNFLCRTLTLRALPLMCCEGEQQGDKELCMALDTHRSGVTGRQYCKQSCYTVLNRKNIIIIIIITRKLLFSLLLFTIRNWNSIFLGRNYNNIFCCTKYDYHQLHKLDVLHRRPGHYSWYKLTTELRRDSKSA